jgi:RNA polymerase sigma-B factor
MYDHYDRSITSLVLAARSAPVPARERMETDVVTFFRPLTRGLARRYAHKGVDTEDLEQVADLALVKAMRRFDPEAGHLRGYVTATVLGEIKRHFRDHAWSVRPPRDIQDLQSRVVDTMTGAPHDVSDRSSIDQTADVLHIDRSVVVEVLLARGGFHASPLDRPSHEGGPGPQHVVDEADPCLAAERRSFLQYVCAGLDHDERELLRLRFVEELTQRQIAVRVDSTQKQVSRTLERVLVSLRARAVADVA